MAEHTTPSKDASWRRPGAARRGNTARVRADVARTNAATAAVAAGLNPELYRPIPYAEAEKIQASHNCDGLSAHLRASPHIFGDGWGFADVVWGQRGHPLPYDKVPSDTRECEYLALEVGNKWNDLALYRRARRIPPAVRQPPVRRRLFADEAGAAAASSAAGGSSAAQAAADAGEPDTPPQDEGPDADMESKGSADADTEPAPAPKPGPRPGAKLPKQNAKERLRNNPFSLLMDSGSASDDSDDSA